MAESYVSYSTENTLESRLNINNMADSGEPEHLPSYVEQTENGDQLASNSKIYDINNCNESEDTNNINENSHSPGASQTNSSSNENDEKCEFSPKDNGDTEEKSDKEEQAMIPVVTPFTNGIIKSGKPRLLSINNSKRNNIAPKTRGRPAKKTSVAMYQSQISDNNHGIKLRIKKSDTQPKKSRKRGRKSKIHDSDSEDSDSHSRGKKSSRNQQQQQSNNNTEPLEQSAWGLNLPQPILYRIFQLVCAEEGCLPALVRMCRVCSLWRQVAMSPSLWQNIELSRWTKEKYRTEINLKWLIVNRLQSCQELNISNWKVPNIACVLEILVENCPELRGLNLTGWKTLTADHLRFIAERCPNLQRLDISSINSEVNVTKSAVSTNSLCTMLTEMGERLTHLLLADNRIAGIQQIVTAIATCCPNLRLLDLSNIRSISHSSGVLHIEKLQEGCQNLRVLRITNSNIVLSNASIQEQCESPGFPNLEELSIASLGDDSRLMDDDAMSRVLKSSTRLKLLDVRGCARITESSLVRVPAWDLAHLFLAGSYVTRMTSSGLELIAQKWAHSLVELDLAWANAQEPLDCAVNAIAEKGAEGRLRVLNLCGSSVSLEPVKAVLKNCAHLVSLNLTSCRGLPRGVKRLYVYSELDELKNALNKPDQSDKSDEDK
ncbi:F-box/LRR-repeat protein 6 [Ctenocephalides felis]|uniref:F-box/LRR-repeat protein 6 n=1 Tax=Ctenocephalides felis TaxID=7515 RepID=UPI000E6E1E39|nr:F-box/LRR-repeat protein 6 [Ctenocephalides felis]